MNEFDKATQRAELTAAVKEAIFCQFSGKSLDKRRAVFVEIVRNGTRRASVVVTAEAWDGQVSENFKAIEEMIRQGVHGYQTTDEVRKIDGREVFR